MSSSWMLLHDMQQISSCYRQYGQKHSPPGPLWKKSAKLWCKGRKELTIQPNSFCRFDEKSQANMAAKIISLYTQTWNLDNNGERSTSLPSHLDSTSKCHQSVCALYDSQGLIINYSTRAPDTIQGLKQDSDDAMW